MNTRELSQSLTTLLSELVNGAPKSGAYMLNRGDPGLLQSLDRIPASAASNKIAAHVEHLRYGLSLMNRWANGERNPFATADWSAAWRTTSVSDHEWSKLRADLRDEAHRWLEALEQARDVDTIELNGIIGSIAHLAYHVGAIRQINQATRGPAEPQLQ